MPLQKQNLNINFAQGLDTKTDPFQVAPGKFLELENTIFTKGGLLQKRNGFAQLPSLPDLSNTFVTTFNGNLTAIGDSFNALSSSSQTWVNKGAFYPVDLKTLPLIRNSTNQTQTDSSIESGGLICTVYTNVDGAGTTYLYAIADSVTGQNIISPTTFTATGSPKSFVLGKYFIVVFPNGTHLKYIAIPISNPSAPTAATDISTQLLFSTTVNYDGYVINNALYLAWNGTDLGGAVRATFIDSNLTQHSTVSFPGRSATLMSVTADSNGSLFPNGLIWIFFWESTGPSGYAAAVNYQLSTVLAPTQWSSFAGVLNITSVSQDGVLSFFYEAAHNYPWDATIPDHFIETKTIDFTGSFGTFETVDLGVGLASKAFVVNGTIYMLSTYQSNYQSTYFLIDSTGNVVAKLAYSNGGGYLTKGLPSVSLSGDVASIPYLFKDLITSVNKNTNVPAGTQINGIYAQLGINLATFDFSISNLSSSEIANNLHLSGGFLWSYDGYLPVEEMFHLYPDLDLNADGTYHGLTTSGAGGNISAQKYFYVVTYEWSDNQGNLFRSAPSVPVSITTIGATSTNTLEIPTLRLTYKIANPVKVCVYRWSTAQQTYYQVTSVTSPTLNSTTTDVVTVIDTFSDATILGNSILYTTGGVVENISAPATFATTLYKSRLFLVDSEDRNLIWYSKQVIEATPVETSDLFTLFVAPTIGAQGNTGPITALSAMDDKLIIFKRDAIYYITGNGPDNTGANNDFSDPVFITSTVGCSNQNSIVFMPQGLMFQSDKGIWLLGRDLSSIYIGAPVEQFNDQIVLSARTIPGTNQVRFNLSGGATLMYDYFYGQWGTFTNVPSLSSTIYQNLSTYIDSLGRVFQESPGLYLDGSNPVLMKLQTSWFNLTGLQGLERAYFFYLLGTYITPHKINVQIAYDYNPSISQSSLISPNNFNPAYGGETLYGSGSPMGGSSSLEQWRVFLSKQKCEAFQITLNELYDPSFGVMAGSGFTLSGINLVVGGKRTYTTISAGNSVG